MAQNGIMGGYRFKNFKPEPASKFDELFKIFKQFITHTSGDVEEALDWLKELDKEYELTNKEYTLDDFIAELKKRGYLRDKTDGSGGMSITPNPANTFAQSYQGLTDSYIACFDKYGQQVWSTYIGGGNDVMLDSTASKPLYFKGV